MVANRVMRLFNRWSSLYRFRRYCKAEVREKEKCDCNEECYNRIYRRSPKSCLGHNRPVVEGKIEFLNNTNRIINVTKLELIDGKEEMLINNPKKILNLRIPPYSNHIEPFSFETPAPPKYVMSPTCKLRVHANDKVLEYDVSTNSHVAPY